MKTNNEQKNIQMLVIDDDPTFRALMQSAAKGTNITVTTAGSLKEVSPLAVPKLFDVVVLDYYLDNIKENLKGTDVAFALEATPILLTSSTEHAVTENEPWANSIRKFVPKKSGAQSILAEAKKIVLKGELAA